MGLGLPQERLLEIIKTQAEIGSVALDLDAVMDVLVRRAQQITGADAGVIELVEGEEMVYHSVSGTAQGFAGVRLRVESSLSGLALRLNEVLHCDDAEADARVDLEAARRVGAMSMVCVPLCHRDRVAGVLKVYSSDPHAFDAADIETLGLLSGLMSSAMANARDFARQQHESRHDALTGLPNRRAFDERVASELARVARYGGALSIALVDVDDFKAVNDSRGHAAGDAVLSAVAGNLGAGRGGDGAFRIGGDEFAMVFVGADAGGATQAMQRLANAVRADRACDGVTISWGVAEVDRPLKAELLERADRALYASKRARGRCGPGRGSSISSPQLR